MKSYSRWILGLVLALVFVAISAQVLAAAAVSADKKTRAYPGGVDEEDLKVQADLPPPPVKVDRKSIEQKALQGYAKKTGNAAAAIVPADDMPNSEEEN